jgi:hypothetical protein
MKPSTLGAATVAPSSRAPTTKPAISLPVSPSIFADALGCRKTGAIAASFLRNCSRRSCSEDATVGWMGLQLDKRARDVSTQKDVNAPVPQCNNSNKT